MRISSGAPYGGFWRSGSPADDLSLYRRETCVSQYRDLPLLYAFGGMGSPGKEG